MGEAKKRGNFEKRKKEALKNIKRGIITPPGKINIQGSTYHMQQGMSADEMLYLSLYWDEILIPTGYIHVSTPFEQELISNKILIRPHSSQIPPCASSLTPEGHLRIEAHELYAFGEFAKNKLQSKGEDWIIQHISDDPMYLPEHRNEQNSIRFRITNSLPFPAYKESFNIDDLLDFKQRRKDQLGELHQSMDELLKRVYLEPIHALRESELKRFENAVDELDKPLIERFKIIRKSDWEVNLSPDIPTLIEKGGFIGSGVAADQALGLSLPVFSSIAALSSILSISKKYGFTFNQFAKDDLRLEYISGAKSEKIIP